MFSRWSFHIAVVLTVLLLGANHPAECLAQARGVETVTKSGTVAEIKTAGRLTTLMVDLEDGEKLEVKVTPTIPFVVATRGDAGFATQGAVITGKGINSNNMVVMDEVTIHLLPANRRPATGQIRRAEPVPGESQLTFTVSGPIAAAGPSQDFPGATQVMLKTSGPAPMVLLNRDCKVFVNSSDPDHAEAGMPIEVTGRALRGGKFNVTSVKILREEPLTTSDDTEN